MAILTLLYHRVGYLKKDTFQLGVSPENFRGQMCWLKDRYPVVRFEEDWSRAKGDAVCITFDDGYLDNFTVALPILEELQIPATVFVATGGMETGACMWWDELERLLLEDGIVYPGTFTLEDELFHCTWKTYTYEERKDLLFVLHRLMLAYISTNQRNDWLEQMRMWREAGDETKGDYSRIWAETRAVELMNNRWLTIGAHTVSHPSLGRLEAGEQREEIGASMKILESLLNRKISTFSYPFGTKGDYSDVSIGICRELGLEKAASNYPGIWEPGIDNFQVPRCIVRDWNVQEFAKQVKEMWEK